MIVFLVGGESRLMDDLITKMEKEGHKTYLLTGKRDRRGKYRRVFERYDFPYDSESVQEIFSNVNPDLVLFLGAYDTNYDWSDARKESVRYTADLTNILSAYAFKQDGRFIYLSSEAVYGRSYSSDIHETESASAKSFQAMALLQGENICRSYRDTRGMDTRILRFDHMYGIPRKGKTDRNPCFWMTLEMLKTNQIAANSRTVFSMIYQDDAVAFAYRAMMEESPKYPLYHITSGEAITQMDLAELIRQNADGVEIRDDTVGEGFRLVLDGSRYQEEFDGKIFVPYEKFHLVIGAMYLAKEEMTYEGKNVSVVRKLLKQYGSDLFVRKTLTIRNCPNYGVQIKSVFWKLLSFTLVLFLRIHAYGFLSAILVFMSRLGIDSL